MADLWAGAKRRLTFSDWSFARVRQRAKTQTRRLLNPQPALVNGSWCWPPEAPRVQWAADARAAPAMVPFCRVAQAGELAWVREHWWDFGKVEQTAEGPRWKGLGPRAKLRPLYGEQPPPRFHDARGRTWSHAENRLRAREGQPHWRARRDWFMPRHFSRMLVRITQVRCEQLCFTSEADARAEGVLWPAADDFEPVTLGFTSEGGVVAAGQGVWDLTSGPAQIAYSQLWDTLHAPAFPWEKNPWVWPFDFELVSLRYC